VAVGLFLQSQLAHGQLPQSTQEESVRRGEYLTRHVAMCVQCHSPRGSDGELIESRLLGGAKVPVENPFPNDPWASYAPQLAGLPGYQPEEVIAVLTRGKRSDGQYPRPPMPPFRMTESDAAAVVHYLQSLDTSRR
jgi:mono/diheme cytochrome c family protein